MKKLFFFCVLLIIGSSFIVFDTANLQYQEDPECHAVCPNSLSTKQLPSGATRVTVTVPSTCYVHIATSPIFSSRFAQVYVSGPGTATFTLTLNPCATYYVIVESACFSLCTTGFTTSCEPFYDGPCNVCPN